MAGRGKSRQWGSFLASFQQQMKDNPTSEKKKKLRRRNVLFIFPHYGRSSRSSYRLITQMKLVLCGKAVHKCFEHLCAFTCTLCDCTYTQTVPTLIRWVKWPWTTTSKVFVAMKPQKQMLQVALKTSPPLAEAKASGCKVDLLILQSWQFYQKSEFFAIKEECLLASAAFFVHRIGAKWLTLDKSCG